MRIRTSAALAIACACGPTPPRLEGDGSAEDTGGDEDPSSASAEDGPGGEVDGNPTIDPDEGDVDESESSGGPMTLCDREPSGLAPGGMLWELYLPSTIAGDIVATEHGIAVVGTFETRAAIATLNDAGEVNWLATWDAPEAVGSIARQVVAPENGVVVAAIDGVPYAGACDDCRTHWLVAFDDIGEPVWVVRIHGGPWAIAATPSGTIAIIDTLYWQDRGYVTTLREVDAGGSVVREVATKGSDIGSPTHLVVGATGNVTAIGTRYGVSDGGWLGAWTPEYAFTEMLGGDDNFFGLALASGGDVIVPEGGIDGSVKLSRRLFGGGIVWDAPLMVVPRDVAVDCDDDIVLATDGVMRLDPSGSLLWQTQLAGEPVAVSLDPEGDVVVLLQFGDELQVAVLAGM